MRITDLVPWRGDSHRGVPARTDPTDPVEGLRQDVDRAFDHFWRMVPFPFPDLRVMQSLHPVPVDVRDDGATVTVTAELPGMNDADLDILVDGDELVIRGEKKSERERDDNGALVRERLYGRIERRVQLPGSVDPDRATARLKDGILTVVLPRSPTAMSETRHIDVQSS